jgi:hypothetical protein
MRSISAWSSIVVRLRRRDCCCPGKERRTQSWNTLRFQSPMGNVLSRRLRLCPPDIEAVRLVTTYTSICDSLYLPRSDEGLKVGIAIRLRPVGPAGGGLVARPLAMPADSWRRWDIRRAGVSSVAAAGRARDPAASKGAFGGKRWSVAGAQILDETPRSTSDTLCRNLAGKREARAMIP